MSICMGKCVSKHCSSADILQQLLRTPLFSLLFAMILFTPFFIFALLDHENTFPFLSFPLFYICSTMRPPHDSPHDLLPFFYLWYLLSMTHSLIFDSCLPHGQAMNNLLYLYKNPKVGTYSLVRTLSSTAT